MEAEKKNLSTPLRISILLLILGFVCSVLHLNTFAHPLLILGLFSIPIFYGIRFWKKSKKGFLAYNKLILVLSWSINGILMQFDLLDSDFFLLTGIIAFILWIILEGTSYLIDDKDDTESDLVHFIWNTLMVIGILAIIIGGLSKILKWEYATPTLSIGFILVTAYIFKDLLLKTLQKKE